MSLRNHSEHYASTLVVLHWLMLLVIIGVYGCIELRELFPKGSDVREALKMWHFMLGLLVLVLAVARVIVRLQAGPAPRIVPPSPAWQLLLARLVHLALYALMLGLPLAGWVILSAAGKPIPFFGLELPPLVGENEALSKQLKGLHELGGKTGYGLIGLHAAAALFHHYVQRDNTLQHMLPAVRPRS